MKVPANIAMPTNPTQDIIPKQARDEQKIKTRKFDDFINKNCVCICAAARVPVHVYVCVCVQANKY